jgi:hypothetical protein
MIGGTRQSTLRVASSGLRENTRLAIRSVDGAPKTRNMKRILISGLIFLAAALFLTRTVSSAPQSAKQGVLSGVVIGPDHKPVPYASITYQSSGGDAPHAVRADAKGHFVIAKLHYDNYDVRATHKGAFSEWERNVAVRTAKEKFVTLHLKKAPPISASATEPQ